MNDENPTTGQDETTGAEVAPENQTTSEQGANAVGAPDAEDLDIEPATDEQIKARREELLLITPTDRSEEQEQEISALEEELTRRIVARDRERAQLELDIAALPDRTDENLTAHYESLKALGSERNESETALMNAIGLDHQARLARQQSHQSDLSPEVPGPNAADRICRELEAIATALGFDVIPFDQVHSKGGPYTDVDRVVHRLIDINLALRALDLTASA